MGFGEGQGNDAQSVVENGEGSEAGRDTLEDLTSGRPHLIRLLDQHLAVTEKMPGDWLFQEGEEVCRCCYIVLGRVDVIAAGEVVATVGSQELLGVDELLLRRDHPTYTRAARVSEPTSLVWLDEDGLISIMGKGALKGFLRLQARVAKQTAQALRRTRIERDKSAMTASQLRRALETTQEELALKERISKFPPRPKPAVPPPPPQSGSSAHPDLIKRLRDEREINQSLVRLLERRDSELKSLLQEMRRVIEKNPALGRPLADFLRRLEAAVIRRENTVVALKPLP